MRQSSVALLVTGLAVLVPAAAGAQTPTSLVAFTRVTRENSPRAGESAFSGAVPVTDPIGVRDCSCENWRFEGSFMPPAGTTTSLEWWVGTSQAACASEMSRRGGGVGQVSLSTTSCWQLPSNIAVPIPPGGLNTFNVVVPARWLVDPINGQCVPPGTTSTQGTLYFTGVIHPPEDMSPTGSQVFNFNRTGPGSPTNVRANAEEAAATVSWSFGTVTDDAGTISVPPNIRGFYVLCLPNTAPADAGMSDSGLVCEGPTGSIDGGTTGTDASTGTDAAGGAEAGDDGVATDAGVATDSGTTTTDAAMDADNSASCAVNTVPAGFDPNNEAQFNAYRCSGLLDRTSTTTRITNLNNGIGYRFVVVAQDNAGNRSPASAISPCVLPELTTDFWERYRDRGGMANPGLCNVHPGPVGAAGVMGLAGGVVVVAALVRRARRRKGDK